VTESIAPFCVWGVCLTFHLHRHSQLHHSLVENLCYETLAISELCPNLTER
jgi:hypothetical protein